MVGLCCSTHRLQSAYDVVITNLVPFAAVAALILYFPVEMYVFVFCDRCALFA